MLSRTQDHAPPAPLPADDRRLAVIIPCFNEVGAISSTLEAVREAVAQPFELIAVDDGSTDGTAEVLNAARRHDPRLTVIAHDGNRGYGAALKTGIRHSRAEWIAILDADGTYPLGDLPQLLAHTDQADMVVGARTADDAEHALPRQVFKAFLRGYVSWLAGRRVPDANSGMRVFRRDVAEGFLKILPDGFSFTTTLTLAMLTNDYRVHYVPIGYRRRVGHSKIRPLRDVANFIQLILRTGMYFAPLRAFFPFILVLMLAFLASLTWDIFVENNLTDKTVMLLMFTLNASFFALLADMIDKRSAH